MRKSAVAVLVGAGSLATAVLLRRRGSERRDHVDLYLGDGTKVAVADGSPELARLLPLAHDVLRTAS